jgi:hypothetical protein
MLATREPRGLLRMSAVRGQPLREHHERNDAVCALAATSPRVRDLYRPVHDILQSLLAEHSEPPAALRELASIRHFDLFVSATPDDLLARALNAVRYHGKPQTDQIHTHQNCRLIAAAIYPFPPCPITLRCSIYSVRLMSLFTPFMMRTRWVSLRTAGRWPTRTRVFAIAQPQSAVDRLNFWGLAEPLLSPPFELRALVLGSTREAGVPGRRGDRERS